MKSPYSKQEHRFNPPDSFESVRSWRLARGQQNNAPLRILIVDDDPTEARVLQRLLEKLDSREIQSAVCSRPVDAHEIIKDVNAEIVIVNDLLDGVTGLDLIQRLRQSGLSCGFILLSRAADARAAFEAMRAGALDYLVKADLSVAVLERTLRYAEDKSKTERALKESEQRQNLMLRTIPMALYTAALNEGGLSISWVSPEIERVTGFSQNLLTDGTWEKHWLLRIHPDDRPGYFAAIDNLKETGRLSTEYRWRGPGQDYQLFLDQAELVTRPDDKSREILGNWLDITERGKAQAKIKLAAKVFENTSDGIVVTNHGRYVTDVNRAFTAITGYHKGAIIGQKPTFLHSDKHSSKFYRQIYRKIRILGCWEGEVWVRHQEGKPLPLWVSVNTVKNRTGKISQFIVTFSDISELKQSKAKLQRLAYYDSLTNLPNRLMFQEHLMREVVKAKRESEMVGLLYLDLDRFKFVNDTLGHSHGDDLLTQVALRLKESLRANDLVARLGGDEFVVVISKLKKHSHIARVAQNIIDNFSSPFSIAGKEIYIGTSIGISLYPDNGSDLETLLKTADTAMYNAKEGGKGCYRFASADMNEAVEKQLFLDSSLRTALKRREFKLLYQPQVETRTGKVIGAEALIRWEHPEQGLISPMDFIPLAEETGVIIPIGQWVLNEACRQSKSWQDAGLRMIPIAVNLSSRQFRDNDLNETIIDTLARAGVPGESLHLELTESAIMSNPQLAVDTLNKLRDAGIGISIDDFGTGYSSLSHLKCFPVCHLKIDRSFITEITTDRHIASAIIALAKNMSMKVIAEGVETEEQLNILRQLDCDTIQGYIYGKPESAEVFEKRLQPNN